MVCSVMKGVLSGWVKMLSDSDSSDSKIIALILCVFVRILV